MPWRAVTTKTTRIFYNSSRSMAIRAALELDPGSRLIQCIPAPEWND